MPRLHLAVIFLVATFCSAADKGQSLALIQHAAEISNIRNTDVGPFRLHARVHILGQGPIDADYVLIWVAPDRWREEISSRDHVAVRIGGKGTVSSKENNEQAQSTRLELRSLDFPALLSVKPSQSVSDIKVREQDGVKVRCVSLSAKLIAKGELCFDSATGALLREEVGETKREFSKYSEFRGKLFPRLVREFQRKGLQRETEVQELSYDPDPDSNLFEADAQYKTMPGCEHPVVPTPIKLPDPEYPPQLRTQNLQGVKLLSIVDEHGSVQHIEVIRSAGPLDRYAIEAVQKWKFAPAICGAAAVPFQFFTEVSFRTY